MASTGRAAGYCRTPRCATSCCACRARRPELAQVAELPEGIRRNSGQRIIAIVAGAGLPRRLPPLRAVGGRSRSGSSRCGGSQSLSAPQTAAAGTRAELLASAPRPGATGRRSPQRRAARGLAPRRRRRGPARRAMSSSVGGAGACGRRAAARAGFLAFASSSPGAFRGFACRLSRRLLAAFFAAFFEALRAGFRRHLFAGWCAAGYCLLRRRPCRRRESSLRAQALQQQVQQ